MASEKQVFSNNGKAFIVGAIDATQQSITVDDAAVFGTVESASSQFQMMTIQDATNIEIIKVTQITGNILTCTRAQEGTTGAVFADGVSIEGRVTKGLLDSVAQGLDNTGNAGGTQSLDFQTGRAALTRIAEGLQSVALGYDNYAEGDYTVAIGRGSSCVSGKDELAWAALTTFYEGDIALLSTSGNDRFMGYCLTGENTTGSVAPSPVSNGQIIVDGTVVWLVIKVNNDGQRAFASGLGAKAMGDRAIAIGQAAGATGDDAIALGNGFAAGTKSVSINGQVQGLYSVGILSNQTYDRQAPRSMVIGNGGNTIADTGKVVGPDFVQLDNYDFEIMDSLAAAQGGAKPHVFTSPPLCLGVKPWVASTVYKSGAVVTPTTPNGYSYYAVIKPWLSYHGTGTSGGTEPGWATTPFLNTYDNGIEWICIDPASVILTLADDIRFIPTEVGFIGQENTGAATTQPFVSFGVSGSLAKWLASTQTTKLTGPFSCHKFDPTNTEGSKTLAASLVTVGDGPTIGRFYWRGICVEALDTINPSGGGGAPD